MIVSQAQAALDEVRRALDVQLDTVESLRNRSTALLGVVAIVAGVAGLPAEEWQLVLIILVAIATVYCLWNVLKDRELHGIMDARLILDDAGITALDEAGQLEHLARSHAARWAEQKEKIEPVLYHYRAVFVLTIVLTIMFTAWGGATS